MPYAGLPPRRSFDRNVKMLVIVVSATACGFKAGYDEAAIQKLYWTDPGHLSVLATCSYNKLTVDKSTFKVLFVDIPCTVRPARAWGSVVSCLGPSGCAHSHSCFWKRAWCHHRAGACMQAGVITSCKENQIRKLAQDGAQRQLGAAAYSQYEYLQYIMPKGADKYCE